MSNTSLTPASQLSAEEGLAGKRVLVTGGTKGTGKAIAARLRAAGAQVIATARTAPEDGESADLSTPAGIAVLLAALEARWGGVDILINNVGGSAAPSGGFAALTDADPRYHRNRSLANSHPVGHALTQEVTNTVPGTTETVVTVLVTGDFPGSPLHLYSHFNLSFAHILDLHIHG